MKVIARPVDMVAWFAKNGCPHPIKFRIENDDKTYSTIKVDRIICRDMEKLAGNNMIVIRCQSMIDNVQRIYELKYELITCRWILFKI